MVAANVRVIFRTAGAESPLESAGLAPLRQSWRRDEERSADGFERDRSGIYGGVPPLRRACTTAPLKNPPFGPNPRRRARSPTTPPPPHFLPPGHPTRHTPPTPLSS